MSIKSVLIGDYPFNCPATDEEKANLLAILRGWRTFADPENLKTLILIERCEDKADISKKTNFNAWIPGFEPVSERFTLPPVRTRPASFDANLDGVTLQIVRPLQVSRVKARYITQVYLAKLTVPEVGAERSDDIGSIPAQTTTNVVVKVYQNSVGPALKAFREDPGRSWNGTLFRWRFESWAYQRLAKLQGSIVPHVLGFFLVEFPHDDPDWDPEPAVAVVMEYVESTPISSLPQNIPDEEVVGNMIRGMATAMYFTLISGVIHCDFSMKNLLWPHLAHGPDNSRWTPVLIDFGKVKQLDANTYERVGYLGSITDCLSAVFPRSLVQTQLLSFLDSDEKIRAEAFRIPKPMPYLYLTFLVDIDEAKRLAADKRG